MSETISNTTLIKCECGKWVNYAGDSHHIARVRKIADLQRLCERAYIEIHGKFGNLVDVHGYGPSNLESDLKKAADGKERRELQTLNDEFGRALSEAIADRDAARAEQQADEKALAKMQLVVEQTLDYCERKALGMSNISLEELEYQCRKVLGKPTEGLGYD